MSQSAAKVRTEDYAVGAFPAFRKDAITGEERVRVARDDDRPGVSPAMSLQRDLAEAVAHGAFDARLETYGKKWSPRRTLAFCFVTCGTFWALVAWAVMRLF